METNLCENLKGVGARDATASEKSFGTPIFNHRCLLNTFSSFTRVQLFYIYKGSISQIPYMGVTLQSVPYHNPFTMLVPTWVNKFKSETVEVKKTKMKMVNVRRGS